MRRYTGEESIDDYLADVRESWLASWLCVGILTLGIITWVCLL